MYFKGLIHLTQKLNSITARGSGYLHVLQGVRLHGRLTLLGLYHVRHHFLTSNSASVMFPGQRKENFQASVS